MFSLSLSFDLLNLYVWGSLNKVRWFAIVSVDVLNEVIDLLAMIIFKTVE